jgi:carboxymethylenebutenolidase
MTDDDLVLPNPELPYGTGVIGVCDVCGERQAIIVLQKERFKLCVLDFLNKTWTATKNAPGRPLPAYRSERVWFPSGADPSGQAQGVLLRPTKPVKRPAILLTPDLFGLTTMLLDAGIRFARAGFEVLLPDVAKLDALGPMDLMSLHGEAKVRGGLRLDSTPARRLIGLYADALRFLREQPLVDPARTGVFGASNGATIALALASTDPTLAAVAVAFPVPSRPPDSLRLINAPLLVLAGDADPLAARARAQLESAGIAGSVPVRYELYPGARHLFLARDHRAYDLPRAEQAWERLLTFYKDTLMPAPPKPPAAPVAKATPPAAPAPVTAAPAPGPSGPTPSTAPKSPAPSA